MKIIIMVIEIPDNYMEYRPVAVDCIIENGPDDIHDEYRVYEENIKIIAQYNHDEDTIQPLKP